MGCRDTFTTDRVTYSGPKYVTLSVLLVREIRPADKTLSQTIVFSQKEDHGGNKSGSLNGSVGAIEAGVISAVMEVKHCAACSTVPS